MNKENKNLYIMKLLVSSETFRSNMVEIRREFSIPPNGFPNKEEFAKWERELFKGETQPNKLRECMERIIDKYRIPHNFLAAIKFYIYFNRITPVFLPSTGFAFSTNPSARKNTAKWVELKTYVRLTEKEIREAIKILRDMQEYYLPPNLNRDVRVHKDIDKAITSEEEREMKKRKNKTDVRKYTSGETAVILYDNADKDYLARQIRHRIKKERKKLFES